MLKLSMLPLTRGPTRLRRMVDGDAEAFAEGTKDKSVQRFGHLPESDYTAEAVREMIANQIEPGLKAGTLGVFTLADARTDSFAGSIVLFDICEDSAELGFWIHPRARGEGHVRHGLRLMRDLSQANGLQALKARTVESNRVSQHCLTEAGFIKTETVHEAAPSGKRTKLIHYRHDLTVPEHVHAKDSGGMHMGRLG